MDTELGLKINKYIHDQCKNGVPHDIGFNVVKLFCEPVVVGQSKQLICECHKPNPNDRGFNWCNNCNRFLTPQQQIN